LGAEGRGFESLRPDHLKYLSSYNLHGILRDGYRSGYRFATLCSVDRENRQPIGRPWLTLAVDVKTRMIAGFHVSLWPPSALSVCLALTHAVLSKTSWLADRELRR
jgi:putative transposase